MPEQTQAPVQPKAHFTIAQHTTGAFAVDLNFNALQLSEKLGLLAFAKHIVDAVQSDIITQTLTPPAQAPAPAKPAPKAKAPAKPKLKVEPKAE